MKRGREGKRKYFTSFRVCFHEVREKVWRRSIDKNRLQAYAIRYLNEK
jgi:hypothetical protein